MRGRACGLWSTSLACGPTCNLLYSFFISKRQNEVNAIRKTLRKATGVLLLCHNRNEIMIVTMHF
jgi:hypothetical protein